MRQVTVHKPGGHDRLTIEEHPTPSPGTGEVLVRAHAVGINFADVVVRMGLYESAKEYVGWPITPGFEVAGTVEATGNGVDTVREGDRVIALTRFGGYATHVCVPSAQVLPKPDGLGFAEAAAFSVVHLTAWYALRELCRLRPGMKILVHSAAGGVGSALVQIARIADCDPVGVVGASHKVETARELGAVAVIDKSREVLWKAAERHAPAGYAVILDANGVETLAGSYDHLAPTGRLVVYGFHTMLRRGHDRPSWPKLAVDFLKTPRFNPIRLTNENKAVLGFNLSYLFERLELLRQGTDELFAWLEAGRLRTPRVQAYPFDEVARAHADLESGATVGKLVLTVAE